MVIRQKEARFRIRINMPAPIPLPYSIDTNACVQGDSAFGHITVINDSVHAGFELNVLHDCDSFLQVNLVNTSFGAVNYSWTLGDGTNSTSQDQNHNYTTPGTYTITLIASDSARCYPSDTISKQVTLLPNVTGDFTVNPACEGQVIQFTNLTDPSLQYVWNFGDGTTSNVYSPSHLYSNPGTFEAQLIIIDSSSCNVRDTVTHSVKLLNEPIAGFNVGDTAGYQIPVTFNNTSLHYTQLLWNFGDGGTSGETNPTNTYNSAGWVKVCLTASNSLCADSICKDVYIQT